MNGGRIIWFDIDTIGWIDSNAISAGWVTETLIHEIGHAIGLKHPHDRGTLNNPHTTGTRENPKSYISTEDLSMAVNASIALERPLLIKGEPGTGKTLLAEEVAKSIDTEIIKWHIKSTTKAQQGLYEYDAITRLRDSQLGDSRIQDISNYIIKGKLWEAFQAKKKIVLLIDEIDKADIEFPNDLLLELDKMEFFVYETKENIVAKNLSLIHI